MKIKNLFLLGAALCLSATSNANVVEKNNDLAGQVKVKKQTDGQTFYVGFEYCDNNSACQQIGASEYYKLTDLERRSTIELTQVGGVILADVGIIAASFFGGGIIAGTLASGAAGLNAGLGGLIVGGSAGSVGTVVLGLITDTMNPAEQFRQSMALRDKVLDGETVSVKSLKDYVERLKLMLAKIDRKNNKNQ